MNEEKQTVSWSVNRWAEKISPLIKKMKEQPELTQSGLMVLSLMEELAVAHKVIRAYERDQEFQEKQVTVDFTGENERWGDRVDVNNLKDFGKLILVKEIDGEKNE